MYLYTITYFYFGNKILLGIYKEIKTITDMPYPITTDKPDNSIHNNTVVYKSVDGNSIDNNGTDNSADDNSLDNKLKDSTADDNSISASENDNTEKLVKLGKDI